ncbi:MAG: amidohydrolase [Thermodesulfobacteriota bacterium]
MPPDLTLINALLFTPATASGLMPGCFVEIVGRRIGAVGSMATWRPSGTGRVLDVGNDLVMPGLVNGHTHAAMTLFRGLADDLPLLAWLERHIFPAEARHVSPEMVFWCTKLAAAEMLLSGTTCVADAYFYEERAAAALAEAGLRAVAAQGVIDFPAPGVPDPADNVAACDRFIRSCRGDELVRPAVFAHSPYTCSPATLIAAKKLARVHDVPFFIHLAETRAEKEMIRPTFAGSPLAYLHSLGLLDERTVCVHGVWLDEEDIVLLAESGAALVSCPESNMKLASGTAPLPALREAGVRVGLGTDGAASNNDLDLFGEMAACAKLHKMHGRDATLCPARDVLAMATGEGAAALGMADVGVLAPGRLADLIVVDIHRPQLTPFFSVDTLVYAARGDAVRSAVINGRLVMEERRILTFDVAEAMERVRELAAVCARGFS